MEFHFWFINRKTNPRKIFSNSNFNLICTPQSLEENSSMSVSQTFVLLYNNQHYHHTHQHLHPHTASARISIKVDDANDHSPKFRKALYYSQVQENLPIGAPVVSITATDDDVGLNARLAYSFKYPEDAYYFSVASVDDTPYGVLRVKRVRLCFPFVVCLLWFVALA